MRRLAILGWAVAALLAPAAGAFAEEPIRLGLDDAVARALEGNEEVLIARAAQAEADGAVREAASRFLPDLTLAADYTRNLKSPVLFFNTDEGLQRIEIGTDHEAVLRAELTQSLFDATLGPSIRAARLNRQATAAEVERARAVVALAVRRGYSEVLLARELVVVQERALAQAEDRLAQVQKFHDAGTAAEFDLLTAQVERDNLRPRLIEAENRLDLALASLKRTVGLPPGAEVEVTTPFPEPAPPPPLEEATAAALAARDDLEALALDVALREQLLSIERRRNWPRLDLESSYSKSASTEEFPPAERDYVDSFTAGLFFEIPVYSGGARAGRIVQQEARIDRARYLLQQLERTVRLEVEQAVLALEAARESVTATRANVARAERALSIATLRFENGLSTQLELDDAELAVTEARTNVARALYDYSVARADLRAAMGGA